MGKYIPFCLTKLLSALHRKDWVEVENHQKKKGFESFMRRRGVSLSKGTRPVAVVRPTLRSSSLLRKEIYQQPFRGLPTDFDKE